MNKIILHAYPPSPVTEKIRVGFGIKQLDWHAVTVPRIPPKPLLMPLTAGYRRAPVMQIGADIYCDSQCILRELERRHPEPTFFPGGAEGMVWGISRWCDGELFDLVVKLVMASVADQLPPDFAKDRARLYLGPDRTFDQLGDEIPHLTSQIHAQFGWIDQRLATGRTFMLGDTPGLPDVMAYYLVWFLRGRWADGPNFLTRFPALQAWEQRMKDIGHGNETEMEAEQALEIAKSATCTTPQHIEPNDPLNLAPGMNIAITQDMDSGDPMITGPLHYADRETVAICHENERVGKICIHFPRVGYRISIEAG
jgi:glutathione S-transferase